MKITIEFNDENPDDMMKMKRMLAGDGMAFALFELTRNKRKTVEWEIETKSLDANQTLDRVFELLNSELEDNGVDISQIVS